MRFPWITCALTLALAAAAGQSAGSPLDEVKARAGGREAKIVNGVLEPNYPTVGALLLGSNPDTAGEWCTGTLIGCKTFLTAGHCVEGLIAANFLVFLPSGGFFTVANIDLHPSYQYPITDVAVLELGSLVNGIAPSPLNTTGTPPPGSPGTVVGFGRSGGDNFDYALKRRGPIETSACPASPFYSGSVCWRFASPAGPPASNSNTCNGDSGGPLFIDLGAGDVVAGITSGGSHPECNPGDLSYDTDVFQQLAFIQSSGGADVMNTTCGPLPQVGEAATAIASTSGELSAGSPQASYAFAVKAGTTMLRVAMTGTEDAGSDFDLYIRQGSPPTPTSYDCRDIGSNQFSYCQIAAPASGTWYALAVRSSGVGTYHTTVTTFERDCSLPANAGLSCDDDNDCTASDVCGGGTCAGSPVLDGNACDDGSSCTGADVCTAGVCGGSAVADGTPCDDGNRCSQPDSCQAGSCVGPAPALACKTPFLAGRAFFQLRDKTPSSGDRLVWKWLRGAQTSKAEFGAPTATTDYSLCVYDESAGVPSRVLEQHIPAGSKWLELSYGFKYRDAKLEQSGVYSILLKAGNDGVAKIVLKGKAHPLGMPDLGLQQDDSVVVQLLNGDTCWQAEYSTNRRNQADQFKARAD